MIVHDKVGFGLEQLGVFLNIQSPCTSEYLSPLYHVFKFPLPAKKPFPDLYRP
jgi:hypothetical protein